MIEDIDTARILMLDDDELATKTFKLLLSMRTSFDVVTFNSAEAALDFLKENEVDLVVSDFVMPDMNGIEFLTELKKIKPSVTSILLTGYADKENAIKAINEVGIYKYLEKPWNDDDLIMNIKNGVERSRLVETIKMQKEIERLRNDFIATLTHDLRTPLLAAIQTLEFFLDGTLGEISDKQKKFLSTMLGSNEDMLGLVNALLEVYKYEAGNYVLNKEHFDFVPLVNQSLQEITAIAQKKNINIVNNMPPSVIIYADKRELRRVVANFIGNAIVHTKDTIEVKISKENDIIKFSVKDNGEGISDEDAKKLFKRFSQGTSKKRSTGTGLGLYLSRQIIEAHGGEIGLDTKLNEGSEFYFKLGDIKND
ncbi:MAG: hybrid sensor histidine kinase/response regulator [bacterium]|nr:hybrid sensor histidine kinase/response regulator [bacterium]